MTKYLYSLLLLALAALAACTNELPYDQLERQPRLIMNAIINADAPKQEVTLSLTGRDRTLPLSQEATLTISVNGELRHTLRPTGNSVQRSTFVFDASFASGDVVRFDARTDDGKLHAWAEVRVPSTPQAITGLNIQRQTYGRYNDEIMRYRFTVHDNPNTRDYYRLTAGYIKAFYELNTDSATMAEKPWVEVRRSAHYTYDSREDLVLSDGLPVPRQAEEEDNGLLGLVNATGVYDDTHFSGSSYMMTIYQKPQSYSYPNAGQRLIHLVEIGVEAINKDYSDYLRALNVYDSETYTEEVSQPVVFPSNVQGGTGMVTIFKRKVVGRVVPGR